MIYTLTLNPAIDYIVRLPGALMPGQINRTVREDYELGGKGINVSRVLHTLGHKSILLGFVAGQTGAWLEAGIAALGLESRFIPTEGMTRINVKLRDREETEINGTGPRITPEAVSALYGQIDSLLPGDVLVLSGSVPGSLPEDTYATIQRRLRTRGITAVVDAAGTALVRALPCRPFLIKPNRTELETLFGTSLPTDADIQKHAGILQDMGARNVLVSLGAGGALLLDEQGQQHRIQSPTGTVINSVGAGDSMVAGFLAGWLETGSYEYALKLGTAAGSATAFSLGLANRDAIHTLLQRI